MEFIASESGVAARDAFGNDVHVRPAIRHIGEMGRYGWSAARLRYSLSGAAQMSELREAERQFELDEYFKDNLRECYLEFRASGVSERGAEASVGALLLGLIENLEESERLLNEQAWSHWRHLRLDAARWGHNLLRNSPNARFLTERMLNIAWQGLEQRHLGEERFLQPLLERLHAERGYACSIRDSFDREGLHGLLSTIEWRAGSGQRFV